MSDMLKQRLMTLDESQDQFESQPCNQTASQYLRTLMEYEADGMIGDDTFLNGLCAIRDYLSRL